MNRHQWEFYGWSGVGWVIIECVRCGRRRTRIPLVGYLPAPHCIQSGDPS